MMKFIASDLDAAKKKAHRALGEKAAIISVRELPSGDVEVTASDKAAPNAPEPAPKAQFAGAARDAVDEGPFKTAAGSRLNETIEQKFSESALSELSGALTGGKSAPRIDMSDVKIRSLAETLAPHGVGTTLLAALINGAKRARIDDDFCRLEAAFTESFTYAPLHFAPTTPIMLVGPTGAGKTSCAAKLASAAVDDGASPVMITADVGRAGAVEQIRSYGDALGIDYFIVESPLDVAQVLKSQRPKGAIIIDTPGVSPYNAGDIAALRSYQETCNAEPVLVLPASGDSDEYVDWALAFKEIGVHRCILTKMDATKRIGAGLRGVFDGGLALAQLSESPFISEGLIPANPEYLARRIIASRPGPIS